MRIIFKNQKNGIKKTEKNESTKSPHYRINKAIFCDCSSTFDVNFEKNPHLMADFGVTSYKGDYRRLGGCIIGGIYV